MKKSNLIIGVVLTVVVLDGGAFWYVNNSQKLKVQNDAEKVVNNNQQQNKQEPKIVKTELIKKFEKLLKKRGEKITLDKIDTSDWKTYTDKKRQFSFKYPKDWYAIPIDSSKDIREHYSSKNQKMEKKLAKQYLYNCDKPFISPSDIKGCVQPYDIVCIVDQYKYKELPKKLTSPLSLYGNEDHCNILIKEYLPVLKSSKKSSGEMLMESIAVGDNKHDKYFLNSDTILYTDSTLRDVFYLVIPNDNFITITTGMKHALPKIIQTLQYIN